MDKAATLGFLGPTGRENVKLARRLVLIMALFDMNLENWDLIIDERIYAL